MEFYSKNGLKTMNPVLIVGIEDYAGLAATLPGCLNDARSWETLLKTRYKVEDITVLLNEKAERKSVSGALASLFKKHTEQFPAIFIYAGHGDRIKRGSFTEDVLVFRSDDGSFSGGDFSSDTLTSLLREHLPKGTMRPPVFALDCCYSGGLIDKHGDTAPRSRSLSDPRLQSGVRRSLNHKPFGHPGKSADSKEDVPLILAAAGPDQSAWDAQMKDGKRHGLFSFLATNALHSKVDLSYKALVFQVKTAIAKDYDFTQSPELSGSSARTASQFTR